MIKLTPTREFTVPIIAECINPSVFKDKACKEIEELEVFEGNKQRNLRELFKVEEVETEAPPDCSTITIHGDLSKVRRVGAAMSSGEIIIKGDVGMHMGEEMRGGRITVHGNVGGWVGAMMKAGTIEIYGNAGDYLGAPYRGRSEGMRGGKIIVRGDVGTEAGASMRKGAIKVLGSVGQFVGFRMRGGTIHVRKHCDGRAGSRMTDGKIVVEGRLESILPTFSTEGVKAKVKLEEETVEGPFYFFVGDMVENGYGKLYVSKRSNPHLDYCNRFLSEEV
jgi:formylmethanofuran dehydrogenase subunit C